MKKNLFTQVQVKKPPRSVFDLSHQVTMSANFGQLFPCLVMDLVPGDMFNISCEALVRLQPLVTPMMSRIDVYVHYFFVPNRLVWDGWEDYITQQPYNDTDEIPAHPYFLADADINSMHDGFAQFYMSYYGFPCGEPFPTVGNGFHINALPFAAYNKIYNDWYRDQNLIQTPIFDQLVDGDNSASRVELLDLRFRAWEHDYLTSALPFAQKGPAVSIPLGNVTLKSPWDSVSVHPRFVAADGDPDNGALAQAADILDPTTSNITIAGNPKYAYNPDGTLQVAPTTINDLRRAYRLQEWYEKQARGGTRYIEVILSHFGIRSSDARLQRPEYITGARTPVSISEVLQTSETSTTPQGNMAGHGVAGVQGNYGRYFAEEHGWIIGIVSIRPKPVYWQGIPKRFLKVNDPFEYYWPEFANIGEQAIQNIEVNIAHATPFGTFGYIPRYAEYKFENNRAAGEFQPSSGGLDKWVSLRDLPADVALNEDFINCTPNYNNFAITEPLQHHFLLNIWHNIRAVRPMPYYGTPTI